MSPAASKFIIGSLLFSVLLYSFSQFQSDNQPPVVKFVSPKNNSTFDQGSPVSYKITVSDKEDGESKFDEINPKEVLLEARRLPGNLIKTLAPDPPGLAVIMTSNCLNCHGFNSKSTGPSFYEINKRYQATKSNMDTLTKRIREGSSGAWPGKEKMPSHPELTSAETQNAVLWIFKNAADPAVNYYIGLEGFFRMNAGSKGTYLLTATYIDHGVKNNHGKHLAGKDMVTIQLK